MYRYCQIIGANLKTTKTPSPYFHRLLFEVLGSLNDRLIKSGATAAANTAANTEISSWLTKGLMDVFDRGLNKVMGVESSSAATVNGASIPKKVQSDTNLVGLMTVGSGTDVKRSGSSGQPPIQTVDNSFAAGSEVQNNLENNSYGYPSQTVNGQPDYSSYGDYYQGGVVSASGSGGPINQNVSYPNAGLSYGSSSRPQSTQQQYPKPPPTTSWPSTQVNQLSQSKSTLVNSSQGSINYGGGVSGERRPSNASPVVQQDSAYNQVISSNFNETTATSDVASTYYQSVGTGGGGNQTSDYYSSDANSNSVSYVSPEYYKDENTSNHYQSPGQSPGYADDLGLGNTGLSGGGGGGGKSSDAEPPKNNNSDNNNSGSSADASSKKSGSSTYFSLLTGWFKGGSGGGPSATTGADGKKVYRMNLGEENNMVYDSVSKRWIVKGSSSVAPSISATPIPGSPAMGHSKSIYKLHLLLINLK